MSVQETAHLKIARKKNGKPAGGVQCEACDAIGPIGAVKHGPDCPFYRG